MILDERNEFCDATSAVLAVGNAIIGDVIDLGTAGRDIGNGEPLYLVIQVDTAFVGATSTTQFQLCSDSTADLATSKTVHLDTGAIGVATLVAGYTKIMALPVETTYERYLGLWETVGTANVTAGKINAFLTHDVSAWRATADGI
jgi:ethanolamine utilization microcompartment shell protein EutS